MYVFPKDRPKIPFYTLLTQPADTLSLKMRILYWIENTQFPEILRGFCEVLPLRATN